MNKLIIDAAKDKIFLMIITNDNNYSITYENTKINYEKLTLLINEFLSKKNLGLKKISEIYVNRGPVVLQELEIPFQLLKLII